MKKPNMFIEALAIFTLLIIGVVSAKSHINAEPPVAITPDPTCRITQTEDVHVLQGNGSMYAIDIHCGERGKPGDAYFPLIKREYLIEAIGHDKRLGNYIVIRHGDTKWVYGHVVTSRKVGDFIRPRQEDNILGQENKSGIWNGYHYHVEIWSCPNGGTLSSNTCVNVSSTGVINPKSELLLKQRGWYTASTPNKSEILKHATSFIASYEGLRLEAYYDVSGYSIGYGTRSYKGEKITAAEAEKRLNIIVSSLVESVTTRMPGLTDQQYVGLISLAYNCHSGIQAIYKNGLEAFHGRCTLPGTKYESGLKERRAAEAELIFSN